MTISNETMKSQMDNGDIEMTTDDDDDNIDADTNIGLL